MNLLNPREGNVRDLKTQCDMSDRQTLKLVLWAEKRGFSVIDNPFSLSGQEFLVKTPCGNITILETTREVLGFLSKRYQNDNAS